jgi:hypothetical protein
MFPIVHQDSPDAASESGHSGGSHYAACGATGGRARKAKQLRYQVTFGGSARTLSQAGNDFAILFHRFSSLRDATHGAGSAS